MEYIWLIVGFILLVFGANFFVSGSSGIAKFFKIPTVIIGLTVVSMGTSAPEAAVNILASLNGSNDIALGNIIGSNIFNLLLIGGICAMLKPLKASSGLIKYDFPFAIIAVNILILCAVINFGSEFLLSRLDGVLLLLAFVIYIWTAISRTLKSRKKEKLEVEKPKHGLPISFIFTVVGLAAIIYGGNRVVFGATEIARGLGVSESLIALTVVSIGTSLPELVTSVVAIKRGEDDIALGNIIGSNIFNIIFILGTSSLITPIPIAGEIFIDLCVLIFFTVLSYLIVSKSKQLSKLWGIIFFTGYIAYTAYIIYRGI